MNAKAMVPSKKRKEPNAILEIVAYFTAWIVFFSLYIMGTMT